MPSIYCQPTISWGERRPNPDLPLVLTRSKTRLSKALFLSLTRPFDLIVVVVVVVVHLLLSTCPIRIISSSLRIQKSLSPVDSRNPGTTSFHDFPFNTFGILLPLLLRPHPGRPAPRHCIKAFKFPIGTDFHETKSFPRFVLIIHLIIFFERVGCVLERKISPDHNQTRKEGKLKEKNKIRKTGQDRKKRRKSFLDYRLSFLIKQKRELSSRNYFYFLDWLDTIATD